jgi:hypothetical protein
VPILIALILAALAAPPASAQEDGVFVDPESPAGKEYAVPLEEARRQASGASAGDSRGDGGGGQPLFGVGIEPVPRQTEAGEGTQSGGGGGGNADEAQGPDRVAPSGQSAAAVEAAASDGSDGLLTAGIAAGVLVAGLLAGLVLRRLLRPRSLS